MLPLGGIGAPTVGRREAAAPATRGVRLRDRLERVTGRNAVAALMAAEIGGANGIAAGRLGRRRSGCPVVDADSMGRAFPEVQQVAMYVAGRRAGAVRC